MDDLEKRRQATTVWGITFALTFVWLLLIVAPAILHQLNYQTAGGAIFSFFGAICHQIPERSFHIGEHQFAVCSRCFGVYFGLVAGLLIYPLWRRIDDIEPLPRKWLLLSIVPMGIDWSLTIFDIWENNHASRFITGLILGAACSIYILPALVEIFRNFKLAKRSAG